MQYQPMMRFMDHPDRNILHQLRLDSIRSGGGLWYETDSFADPEYMRVHCHVGLLINHGCDNICRLSSNAPQLHQFIHRHWDLSIKLFHYHLCHPNQMLCLVVGIADTFNKRKNLVKASLAERHYIRVLSE